MKFKDKLRWEGLLPLVLITYMSCVYVAGEVALSPGSSEALASLCQV